MPVLTRLYRAGVLVAIVWLVHASATRAKVLGDAPIKLEEVRHFLPNVVKLDVDPSEKRGLIARDAAGVQAGYALRTSPTSDHIKGYVGSTDTLLVLDGAMRVVGIRVRSSQDTKDHVFEKVVESPAFMEGWNGLNWDEVAAREAQVGWHDVAGATLSSMAIAKGIQYRFKSSIDEVAAGPAPIHFGWDTLKPANFWSFLQNVRGQTRWTWHDYGLVCMIGLALAFSFTPMRSRTWLRRAFQLLLIVYLGYFNGQILSQALMGGWAEGAIPWRTAPALALLLAVALVVPWLTRRQVYCSQICPHGAAQEWMGRLTKKRLHLPKGVDRGLRWLPPLLIALVLFNLMFDLPIDPADTEPFVAYQIWSAAFISIAIAVGGLLVSIFVPMAYCKYGCPTGSLLSFVRSHGKADGFGRRDLAAGLLVAMVAVLHVQYDVVRTWIHG